ncbi:UNVERIFIED_CONTAM: Transcription factor GTE7 [Sesamum latifolium]|uniref:Transcription factor GTE7 n=1 Tax=Sesamum latifolium TaxID=2727402 RepID=A0AAW2V1M1_9LAMI
MASAVLASQNDSGWGHMGKTPYSNPHLNGNPNPNPKKKQKQFHHPTANGVVGRYHNNKVDSPAVTQTASDDAYSFNQTSTSRNAGNYGSYLTFNVASYRKSELFELRKRLSAELEQIRDLRDRIESGQINIVENPRSQPKLKKFPGNKRPISAVGSAPKKISKAYENGSLDSVSFEGLLKECSKIVAKLLKHKYGYIFKMPVDAVALGLHDYHLIVKRPMDLGTVKANLAKNFYPTPIEFAADMRLTFNNALLYNPKSDPVNGMADQMLARFEELFRPIQEKIDKVSGQRREREFRESRANADLQFRGLDELQGSSWNNHNDRNAASPVRVKKAKPKASPVPSPQVFKKPDRMVTPMPAHSSASTPSHPPPPSTSQQPLLPEELPASPVRAPALPSKDQKAGRGGAVKLPKPRAKDPNKREMSMEEKQKLGIGLQSLPQEKMPQLVQIIRKRNEHLAQDGDEIELDIEALDTETLWELDRFVTNWKKMVSKTKRQALLMNINPAGGVAPTSSMADADMGSMSDKNDDSGKKSKENDDEEVDIDDDMPATSFPPVEIEKDDGMGGGGGGGHDHDHDPVDHGNASSSSSSSGSSSSDSSSSSGIDTYTSCVSTLP